MSVLHNSNILRTLAEKNMLISCRRLGEIMGVSSSEEIDALSKKLSYMAGKNYVQRVKPHSGGKWTYRITDAGKNLLAIMTGIANTTAIITKPKKEAEQDAEPPISAEDSEILSSLDNLSAQLEAPAVSIKNPELKRHTLQKLAALLGKPLARVLLEIDQDIENLTKSTPAEASR